MDINAAARLFAENRLAPRPLERLSDGIRPESEGDAAAIQPLIHEILEENGLGLRVGYKIGCTTPVMQEFLNIRQPCAGGIMANTVHHHSADLRHKDYARIGIECEIAVRLGADLIADEQPHTRESVRAAIDSCMAAAEIVDDRYADFHTMGTPSLMADDFFGAGCVLGEPISHWQDLDLAAIEGRTLLNSVEMGRGTGDAVLGHPLEAVAWLANSKTAQGEVLLAGEIVLTGSLVETKWPENPDDLITVQVSDLGSLDITIS